MTERTGAGFRSRATDVYLAAMLSVPVLFTGTDGYLRLGEEKFWCFAGLTLLWLLCLLVSRLSEGGPFRFRPMLPELLVFAVVAVLTTALHGAPFFDTREGRFAGLCTYLLYAALLAGVYRCGKSRFWLVHVLGASYTFCCGVTLLQLLGRNPLHLYVGGIDYYSVLMQETGGMLSTIGNISLLSALHCLAIPLFAAHLFRGRERLRFWLLLPVALGLVCAVWVRVASGLLALAVCAALFLPGAFFRLFAARRGKTPEEKRVVRFGLVCFAAAALCALALLYFLPLREGGHLYEIHRLLHGELSDSFGSNRIGTWQDALRVIGGHPLLGVGPGRYIHHTAVLSERWSEALGQLLRAVPDDAHNAYLQLALCFGVLGVLPLLALLARTVRGVLAAWKDSPALHVLVPPLLCYMIQGFFNISSFFVEPLFLIGWGLTLTELPLRPPPAKEDP